jgi:hypothetical protein
MPPGNRIQVELVISNPDDALNAINRVAGAGANASTNFDLLSKALDDAYARLARFSQTSIAPINVQLEVTERTIRTIAPQVDQVAAGFQRVGREASAARVQVEGLADAQRRTFIAGSSGPAMTDGQSRFMRATSAAPGQADRLAGNPSLLGRFNRAASAEGGGDSLKELSANAKKFFETGEEASESANKLAGTLGKLQGAAGGGARGLSILRNAMLRLGDIPEARPLGIILQMFGGATFALASAAILGLGAAAIYEANKVKEAALSDMRELTAASIQGTGPTSNAESRKRLSAIEEIALADKQMRQTYMGPSSQVTLKTGEALQKAGLQVTKEESASLSDRLTGYAKVALGAYLKGVAPAQYGDAAALSGYNQAQSHFVTTGIGTGEQTMDIAQRIERARIGRNYLFSRNDPSVNPETGRRYDEEARAPERSIEERIKGGYGQDFSAGNSNARSFAADQAKLLSQVIRVDDDGVTRGTISVQEYDAAIQKLGERYLQSAKASEEAQAQTKKWAEAAKEGKSLAESMTKDIGNAFKGLTSDLLGDNPFSKAFEDAQARGIEFQAFSKYLSADVRAQWKGAIADANQFDLFKARVGSAFATNDLTARRNELENNPDVRYAYANAQAQRQVSGLENIANLRSQLGILTGEVEDPAVALRRRLQTIAGAPSGEAQDKAIAEAVRGVNPDVLQASGMQGFARGAIQNLISKQESDLSRNPVPRDVQAAQADLESVDALIKRAKSEGASSKVTQLDINFAGKAALAQLEKIAPQNLTPELRDREIELLNQQIEAQKQQEVEAKGQREAQIKVQSDILAILLDNFKGKDSEEIQRARADLAEARASVGIKIENGANASVSVSGDTGQDSLTGGSENNPGVTNPAYAGSQSLAYADYGQ